MSLNYGFVSHKIQGSSAISSYCWDFYGCLNNFKLSNELICIFFNFLQPFSKRYFFNHFDYLFRFSVRLMTINLLVILPFAKIGRYSLLKNLRGFDK